MSRWSDADCLNTDPFGGDFGEPGERRLANKIVTNRKSFVCHDCGETQQPGGRTRVITERNSDGLCEWRWCEKCCEAQALSQEDAGVAWERRIALRRMTASEEE